MFVKCIIQRSLEHDNKFYHSISNPISSSSVGITVFWLVFVSVCASIMHSVLPVDFIFHQRPDPHFLLWLVSFSILLLNSEIVFCRYIKIFFYNYSHTAMVWLLEHIWKPFLCPTTVVLHSLIQFSCTHDNMRYEISHTDT